MLSCWVLLLILTSHDHRFTACICSRRAYLFQCGINQNLKHELKKNSTYEGRQIHNPKVYTQITYKHHKLHVVLDNVQLYKLKPGSRTRANDPE